MKFPIKRKTEVILGWIVISPFVGLFLFGLIVALIQIIMAPLYVSLGILGLVLLASLGLRLLFGEAPLESEIEIEPKKEDDETTHKSI